MLLSHLGNHGLLLNNNMANMFVYTYPQVETVYLKVPTFITKQGPQRMVNLCSKFACNRLVSYILV